MSSILECIDDTTRDVVMQIVSKYKEDILKYNDNSDFQTIGIGTELNSLLLSLCNCILKQSDLSGEFVLIVKRETPNFPIVNQKTCYSFNNGLIVSARALQIINFLKRLSDEGLILFADATEYKSYPQYRGMTYEEENSIVCSVQNKRLNNFIKAVYYSHIFPTETLIGFVENGLKTNEQIRFEHQKELSERSLNEAQRATTISEKSVEIAEEANKLAQQSLMHAKRGNYIAIGVALLAMMTTVFIGLLPSSITTSSIHEVGREIRLNTQKESSHSIIINNFQEKDSTKYGKTTNEER